MDLTEQFPSTSFYHMAYRRRRYYRLRVPRRVFRSSFHRAARSSARQFAAANAQRDIARFTIKYSVGELLQVVVPGAVNNWGTHLDMGKILI